MVVTFCCSLLLALAAQENASLHLEVRRAADEQILAAESLVYQGEVLFLDLEITFTEEFHNRQLINPWRMPLDVPVELQLPWLQESDHWQVIAFAEQEGSSIVINRDKSLAKRLESDDENLIRYLVRRKIRVSNEQSLQIPAATMKVVWATKFEDDLARGLVPLDRQEAQITAEAIHFLAAPVPEQGRPMSFKGAVGKFDMRMDSELRVNDGETQPSEQEGTSNKDLIWDIMIYTGGHGWLEKEMLVTLDSLQGFHVRGQKSEMTDDGMVLIAELSTTDSGLLPSLPTWSYFNPSTPAHFVTIGVANTLGNEVDENTAADSSAGGVGEPPLKESSNLQLYWIGAGGALFVFGMLHLMRRRPESREVVAVSGSANREAVAASRPAPREAVAVSRPAPREAVVAPAPRPKAVPSPDDFIQQLADHFGCKREQVYSGSFDDHLASAELPAQLREEIQAAVKSIVSVRFCGQGAMPTEEKLGTIMYKLRA